jgi:predicted pyridoxine 5'-phosphate oxidase superfamily flavin-nucleotide-binding protein
MKPGRSMGILTGDMRRVIEAELGFIATVCPDGTPNLSPKGRQRCGTTTSVFPLVPRSRRQWSG